jgi:hypothetical protein
MTVPRNIDVWCTLVRRSDLTNGTKVVAWALSSFMDNTTLEAWPTEDRLADETGMWRSTVQKALGALEQMELVAVTRGAKHRQPNGTWRKDVNLYRGLIPATTDSRRPKTDDRFPTTSGDVINYHSELPGELEGELAPVLVAGVVGPDGPRAQETKDGHALLERLKLMEPGDRIRTSTAKWQQLKQVVDADVGLLMWWDEWFSGVSLDNGLIGIRRRDLTYEDSPE